MTERLGWKVGYGTSEAMALLGTLRPLAAPLTTATLVEDGGTVAVTGWSKPMLEAELAVRIDARGGLAAIAPAIELVDLNGPLDDLAAVIECQIFHRAVVLGMFAEPELANLTIEVCRDGELAAGPADVFAIVGYPHDVLSRLDADLRPGDVVITGAALPMIPIVAGEQFQVRIVGLGEVGVACR